VGKKNLKKITVGRDKPINLPEKDSDRKPSGGPYGKHGRAKRRVKIRKNLGKDVEGTSRQCAGKERETMVIESRGDTGEGGRSRLVQSKEKQKGTKRERKPVKPRQSPDGEPEKDKCEGAFPSAQGTGQKKKKKKLEKKVGGK